MDAESLAPDFRQGNAQKNASLQAKAPENVYWAEGADRGSGFYNPTTDLYKEFYIDGPDTFKINKTEKKTT